MKIFYALGLLAIVYSVQASAAGQLTISLDQVPSSQRSAQTNSNSGVLRLALTNSGDETILVDQKALPIPLSNGRLINDALRIVDDSGVEAKYKGMFVSFADESASEKEIKAGDSINYQVDLPSNYHLEPGKHYTVSLRFGAHYRQKDGPPASANKSLHSSEVLVRPVEIWIDPRSSFSTQSAIDQPRATAAVCTAAEQSAFANAKSVATSTALMGAAALSNMYHTVNDVTTFPYNARYWKWFGAHVSPVPNPGDSNDNYVDQGVITAWFRISDDTSQGPRPAVTLACGDCPQELIDRGAIAFTYKEELYVIHTCPAFFDDGSGNPQALFPEGNPDYVSLVKTLLHEVTHFADEHWDGTIDVAINGNDIYDYGEVQFLSSSDRTNAVRNASNYGFYFINYDGD